MIGHRIWTAVAVIGALAGSAGLASAAVSASAHRAKAPNPSAAVHTATAHHRAHRAHHRAPGPVIATNRMAPIRAVDFPGPAVPQKQRPHRATLPAIAQVARHAPTTRYGPRHAPAARGEMSTIVPDPRALETRPDATPDPRILAVTGGRGPPRGSPNGPSRGRATPAPAADQDPDACASASPITAPAAFPHWHSHPAEVCRVGPSPHVNPGCPVVSEAGSGRLHADRSEGATACFSMPSNGGTPCPASSPSRC